MVSQTINMLIILLSVGLIFSPIAICSENFPTLKMGNNLNNVALKDSNTGVLYELPKNIKDKSSFILQSFDSGEVMKDIDIQFGTLEVKNITDSQGKNTTDYTFIKSEYSCKISKPNQKCLLNKDLFKMQAVKFICKIGPCNADFKAYSLNENIIQDKNGEQKFVEDILLLRYNPPSYDENTRIVIETKLKNSPNKANDTVVQFFDIETKIQIIQDYVLIYIELGVKNTNPIYFIYSGQQESTIDVKLKQYSLTTKLVADEKEYFVDYYKKNSYGPAARYSLQFLDNKEYDYIKFIFKWYEVKQKEVFLVATCNNESSFSPNTFWYSSFTPTIDEQNQDKDSTVNKQYSLIMSRATAEKEFKNNYMNFFLSIIAPDEVGFFKIAVQVQKSTYPIILLDEMVAGKMKGDIINLMLKIPKSPYEQITVDLKNVLGEIDIYLRECKSTECSKEYFTADNKKENLITSETQTFKNSLKSVQLKANCDEDSQGNCQFMIGLVPVNQNITTQYKVEVFSDSLSLQQLTENKQIENIITMNKYQYYSIDLEKIDQIKQVSVKTSSSHVQLYVSADNKCMYPSFDCPNTVKLQKGLNTQPVIVDSKEVKKGVVYIGVYAYTSISYSLVVEVERVDERLMTQIISGSLYQGQLSTESPVQYFTFNPNQNSKGEVDLKEYDYENIEINVRGQKDKIVILVNNDGTLPTEKKSTWISTNGVLFISKNDKKYKKTSEYKIAIMTTEHAFLFSPTADFDATSPSSLQFQLLVTTAAHTKIIELGQPLQDTIQMKGEKLYEVFLSRPESYYIISHHAKDHNDKKLNIKMLIGKKPYDKYDEYEIQYKFSDGSYVLTYVEMSQKLCKENENSCFVFIGLVNDMNEDVNYTITLYSKSYAIELKEGQQHQDYLNQIDSNLNFYYFPSNKDHPLNIFVSSIYGHTSFNVRLWSNKDKLPSIKWPFPTSNEPEKLLDYHYNSGIHNSHSITFSTEAFDKCWPDCVLLISLSYYKGMPLDGQNVDDTKVEVVPKERYSDKYTILVSTIYSDLQLNQRLEFTLESQDSKFFYLSINNLLKSKQKDYVLIEMTSLSGKASIGAMMKDDEVIRYPDTLKNKKADFVSYSNYLNITKTALTKVMEKNKISVDKNPQLVIQVSCISDSAGKFILSAMQGNSTVLDLMHGLPQEIYINPNQTRHFKYFHFSDSDFSIKFSREIGFADLSLRICKDQKTATNQDFQDCLSNVKETISSQHAAGEASSTIHISRSSDDYCQHCLYIIGLKGEQTETHAFLNVLLQQDFTWLQEGRQIIDSVDKNNTNLYRLSVDSDEEAFVTLQQYTGNVQLIYSYRYTYDLKEYSGNFIANANDKFIHLTLRPRAELFEEDPTFNPFNKPQLDRVSKKDDAILVEDLGDYFYEAEIFLAVVNKDKDIPANYSLVFNAGDEYRYIYDGQIMGSSIPPQKNITYLYHHFDYEVTARLNIFTQYKKLNLGEYLKVYGFHDLQKDRRDYRNISRDPIQLELIASHDQLLSYSLPERNGTYELVFSNTHKEKDLNISLSVNSRDILLLPLTQRVEHALTPSSMNYYEVIAPKNGYITIQLTHCVGDLTLKYSQDYDSFLEGEYTSSFRSASGNTPVYIAKVKQGHVYISIETGLDEAFFKIRADFFTSQKNIPHDKILPGNQGVVYNKRSVGGATEISFSPIQCEGCQKNIIQKAKVQYDVIYSKDIEILNVMGKCQTSNYFEHDAKNQLHFKQNIDPQSVLGQNYKQKSFSMDMDKAENIKFVINLDNDDEIYYVSVIASVTNIPNNLFKDLIVFYENSQINKVQVFVQGEASVYAFLFACILIMAFFCMTTCLFWRRYKTMQQGLQVSHKWRDVEMQQEKQKNMYGQKHNDDLNSTEFNNSFADQSFENPDLYEPSENDLRSHMKSHTPLPTKDKDENPFDKISVKINPPQSGFGSFNSKKSNPIVTKQGYDEFIDEN